LLSESQRDRIEIVLVTPRNPLNIGAVARAMANFGFAHLTVVAPYEPHWREAKSAVGSAELLQDAKQSTALAEAIRDCTLVLGTGTLTHRKPDQPVVRLDDLAPHVNSALQQQGHIAIVLGPEKHGLTRDDLSHCHMLVEIPTDPLQPSMNLGQAAAVILYELATRAGSIPATLEEHQDSAPRPTTSGNLDILAALIEEVMVTAHYSPNSMQEANHHDLRVMLRRLNLNAADTRRALGLFRRILWRFRRHQP
jgi:tRNA/rRNA methyltransferase